MSAVGDRVRNARDRLGWSQVDVAKEMSTQGWKWAQATVWNVEKGERPLRLLEAVALSSILGVTLDWLATGGHEGDASNSFQAGFTAGIQTATEALLKLSPKEPAT